MSVPAFGGRGLLLVGILLSVGAVSGEEYYLTNTDNAYYDGQNKYRSFNAAGWWSSGAAPCAGNNYTVTNVVVGGAMTTGIQLRVPDNGSLATPVVFGGDRLTVGSPTDFSAALLGWGTSQSAANRHQKSLYQVKDLHCYGANIYCNNTGYLSLLGTGTVHKVDNNNHVTAFYGSGFADNQQRGIVLGLKLISEPDVVTRLYCGAGENSGNRTSRIYVEGDMSDYRGKLRANYSSTTVIFDSPTMCLGGVEEFVADRLQIFQNAALSIYPHCVQHRNWGVKIYSTTGGGNFFLETDAESGPFDFILPVTAEDTTMSMTVRGPHPVTLKSDMTNFRGTLKVAPGGALVLDSAATLPENLPLEVGDNATLGFSADYDAESGLTTPVLLRNATLGENVRLTVSVRGLEPFEGSKWLPIARIPAEYGSFAAADFLNVMPREGELPYSAVQVEMDPVSGDTLVSLVVSFGAATATWDGGGADTSFATAANWTGDVVPDYFSGALVATFATGGNSASIFGAVAFRGLTFALPAEQNSFVLAKASEEAHLTLGNEGVVALPPVAESVGDSFVVEPSVTLAQPQRWRLASGTSVAFNGGIAGAPSVDIAASDIPDGATGGVSLPCVGLTGDNSGYTGRLVATNVSLAVAGTNVLGTGTAKILLSATHLGALDEANCLLRTQGAGASITNLVRTETAPRGVVFLFGAGTTNVFYREVETFGVTINGTKYSNPGLYRAQAGSYTRFNTAPTEDYSFFGDAQSLWFDGEGTVSFEKCVYNSSGISFGNADATKKLTVHLCGTNNYGFSTRFYPGCDAHVFAPGALNCRSQYSYDNRTCVQIDCPLDLHGTTQNVWRAQGAGTVTSAEPAVFSPCGVNTNMSEWIGVDQWDMNLVFDGAVDFVMASGRTTLKKVSPSTGELAATNGWIKLTAAADWPNARGVRVERDGQLTLAAGGKFGEKTEWRVGGNGRIHIPEGVVQKCGKLYFNDIDAEKPVKPGIYGSAEAQAIYPAAHVDAHLTGKGLLKVVRAGFSISFR